MMRLSWNDPGTRFFETGIDRGVLYVGDTPGVAWNGLTSISETSGDATVKEHFLDGENYANVVATEDFRATITAFASPHRFAACEGIQRMARGLYVTQQPRQAFSLSYRTLIGNDVDGADHAYKIHLVYNALAGPAQRSAVTISDSPEPVSLSWEVVTLPPSLTGYKPTAHIVIDTREVPAGLLKAIEDILYGTDTVLPRIPQPSELISMFSSQGPVLRRNEVPNPAFRALAGGVEVFRNLVLNPAYMTFGSNGVIRTNQCTDPRITTGTGWVGVTGGTRIINAASAYSPNVTAIAADVWTVSAELTADPIGALTGSISVGSTAGGLFGSLARGSTSFNIPAGTTQRVSNTFTLPTGADGLRLYMTGIPAAQVGKAKIDKVLIERASYANDYFDGAGPSPYAGLTAAWTGTANASTSTLSGPLIGSSSTRGYNRNSWVMVGAATDGTNTSRCFPGVMLPTVPINSLLIFTSDGPPAATGDYVSGRIRARLVPGTSPNPYVLNPTLRAYTAGGSSIGTIVTTPQVTLPIDGTWVDIVIPPTLNSQANTGSCRFYITIASPTSTGYAGVLELSNVMVQVGSQSPRWFSGATAAGNDLTYSWVGTANNSASVATGVKPANWGGSTGLWRVLSTPDGQGGYFAEVRGVINSQVTTVSAPIGTYWAARCILAPDPFYTYLPTDTMQLAVYDGSGYVTDRINVQIPTEPIEIFATSTVPTTGATPRVYIYGKANRIPFLVSQVILEQVSGPGQVPGKYFDGSFEDVNKNYYSWAGTPDASASILNTWN